MSEAGQSLCRSQVPTFLPSFSFLLFLPAHIFFQGRETRGGPLRKVGEEAESNTVMKKGEKVVVNE